MVFDMISAAGPGPLIRLHEELMQQFKRKC